MRLIQMMFALLPVLLSAVPASAQQLEVESSTRQVTLVELFTSEGCSSCPPAEAWMNGLRDDPRLWSEVVPVAFHVDYWDYIGWPDRFAVPENSRRQRDYAREGRVSSVYTPGLVTNGEEWRGWFRSRILTSDKGRDVGSLGIRVEGQKISARFQPSQSAQDLFLNIALLGFDLSTEVKAGENHGRTLDHQFVVLGFRRVPMTAAAGSDFVANAGLPKARVESPRYGVAAWVSEQGSQAPIQATGGILSP